MSRESLVILLGLLVFFTPALGIPEIWRNYILTGTGLILVLVGYLLRRAAYLRKTDLGNGERGTDSFVESHPLSTEEPLS